MNDLRWIKTPDMSGTLEYLDEKNGGIRFQTLQRSTQLAGTTTGEGGSPSLEYSLEAPREAVLTENTFATTQARGVL